MLKGTHRLGELPPNWQFDLYRTVSFGNLSKTKQGRRFVTSQEAQELGVGWAGLKVSAEEVKPRGLLFQSPDSSDLFKKHEKCHQPDPPTDESPHYSSLIPAVSLNEVLNYSEDASISADVDFQNDSCLFENLADKSLEVTNIDYFFEKDDVEESVDSDDVEDFGDSERVDVTGANLHGNFAVQNLDHSFSAPLDDVPKESVKSTTSAEADVDKSSIQSQNKKQVDSSVEKAAEIKRITDEYFKKWSFDLRTTDPPKKEYTEGSSKSVRHFVSIDSQRLKVSSPMKSCQLGKLETEVYQKIPGEDTIESEIPEAWNAKEVSVSEVEKDTPLEAAKPDDLYPNSSESSEVPLDNIGKESTEAPPLSKREKRRSVQDMIRSFEASAATSWTSKRKDDENLETRTTIEDVKDDSRSLEDVTPPESDTEVFDEWSEDVETLKIQSPELDENSEEDSDNSEYESEVLEVSLADEEEEDPDADMDCLGCELSDSSLRKLAYEAIHNPIREFQRHLNDRMNPFLTINTIEMTATSRSPDSDDRMSEEEDASREEYPNVQMSTPIHRRICINIPTFAPVPQNLTTSSETIECPDAYIQDIDRGYHQFQNYFCQDEIYPDALYSDPYPSLGSMEYRTPSEMLEMPRREESPEGFCPYHYEDYPLLQNQPFEYMDNDLKSYYLNYIERVLTQTLKHEKATEVTLKLIIDRAYQWFLPKEIVDYAPDGKYYKALSLTIKSQNTSSQHQETMEDYDQDAYESTLVLIDSLGFTQDFPMSVKEQMANYLMQIDLYKAHLLIVQCQSAAEFSMKSCGVDDEPVSTSLNNQSATDSANSSFGYQLIPNQLNNETMRNDSIGQFQIVESTEIGMSPPEFE